MPQSELERIRHGGTHTPEYTTWQNMRARCSKPNARRWARYGARGIKVCERWQNSFPNFLADMGKKPGPNYSIDRIDNDGNYEPSNCRWATNSEQVKNATHPIPKSGYRGIYITAQGHFKATISVDCKPVRLGTYPTVEKALEVQQKALSKFKVEQL